MGGHGFSDKFVNTVHNSNQRYALILKQRLNLNFNTVASVLIANFYVRDWANSYIALDPTLKNEFLLDLEATSILDMKTDFLFLLLTEKQRRIVQIRLISNLVRSMVWIASGLLTISQIVARILATGFPVALRWLALMREEVV